jgi:hypothetical protein
MIEIETNEGGNEDARDWFDLRRQKLGGIKLNTGLLLIYI